jgi:hypothetical protein
MHSSVTATSTVLVIWSRSSFTQAHPILWDGVRDTTSLQVPPVCNGDTAVRDMAHTIYLGTNPAKRSSDVRAQRNYHSLLFEGEESGNHSTPYSKQGLAFIPLAFRTEASGSIRKRYSNKPPFFKRALRDSTISKRSNNICQFAADSYASGLSMILPFDGVVSPLCIHANRCLLARL